MAARPTVAAAISRRRAIAIAAQIVIVAVVGLLVALTLLQPDAGDPLFGVSTPEEAERVQIRDRPDRDRDERGERRRPRRERALALVDGPADAGAAAFAGGVAGSASSPGGALPGGARETVGSIGGDSGEDSPTTDQYDDALARLTARLD